MQLTIRGVWNRNNIGQPWIDYLLAGAELLNHHYFYACQCKISNFTGWNGVIAACWQISSQDKGFWVFPFIQRHKECLYLIFFNPARHVDYLRTFLRFNFELGFPFRDDRTLQVFQDGQHVHIYGWPSLMFITNMVLILGSNTAGTSLATSTDRKLWITTGENHWIPVFKCKAQVQNTNIFPADGQILCVDIKWVKECEE